MVPGLDGHLLSGSFIEGQLPAIDSGDIERARGDLIAWRTRCAMLGPASTPRTLLQTAAAPFFAALGFEPPAQVETVDSVLAATLRSGGHTVALLVTPWGEALDPLWRLAVTQASRRSAAWCVFFDGLHLRIVDAGRLYARRHLEFDLDLAIDDPRSFAALWRTSSSSALAADPADARSLHALVAASDRHAAGVCRSLRDGVLAASAEVLRALIANRNTVRLKPDTTENGRAPVVSGFSRTLAIQNSFEQALTIVYRMLFLLFAEARALVPLWHPIYRESYSLEALRDVAERSPPPPGLWDALRAIARLAHAGCRAGDLRVTPFNGRLFAPAGTPLAERRDLDDEAARRALIALSTRPAPDRAGRERIAYRDLGVEQLGAVYETLLDYEPRADRTTVTLESGSGVRKATGTFYTPQAIAEYLVRRTLGPLADEADADRILRLRIVDPAMGSGAFLVAACRYLADAYEAATIRGGGRDPSDFTERERIAVRRAIAERCLYGVNVNPMAVQLARLSLWLATLAADRPLTFLDHHLQAGDSLVGAWIAALGRAPAGRRARQQAPGAALPFDDARRALQMALPVRFSLEAVPDDTLEQVREKERALAALARRGSALSTWKRVADAWCAAWFAAGVPSSAFTALSDAILTGRSALPKTVADAYLHQTDAAASAQRFFHWELEFPEAFFDSEGVRLQNAGFDAVIGNPPWEMLRADGDEDPRRPRSRGASRAMVRFTRDSGAYASQSDGHANQYQLFLERALSLTRHGGRIGLVLPSGLAADHGSARLRARLLATCDADALVGFDNRRGIFPIHRSVRFLLLTATSGSPTQAISCRFGISDPGALEAAGSEVRLTPAVIERLSGGDLTIPDLRTPLDLAIAERSAALFPPLGSDAGWRVQFGREVNATDDRGHFRPARSGLPIVEGKQIEPFRVDVGSSRYAIGERDARALLRSDRFERRRLAYRDVASATNRRTLIAAILP